MTQAQQLRRARGVGRFAVSTAALALLIAAAGPAGGAESGTSFYLLGQRGQGAAVLPPVEGVFFALPNYFYSGDISRSRNLSIGGALAFGVDTDVFLTLPTAIWVTPVDVFGGDLAFSGSFVYGNADVTAQAALSIPGVIDRQIDLTDDRWAVGDPVLGAQVGWHGADHHYLVAASLNVPVGDYDAGRLSNTSLNRWVLDLTGSGTWLFAEKKVELSAAAGFTLNGENDDTDYETGDEIHVEGAAFYQVMPAVSVGLNGYYYKQVSGDSGAGARLGDFKGRAAGIGPGLTGNFHVGPAPVTINLRYFSEFSVENRLEGDTVWLTLAMPLWVPESASEQMR